MIDRKVELRRYVRQEAQGLEIAPWIKPIVAKSAGFNALSLDVFDYDRLVHIAEESNLGWMVPAIEAVDLLGSATDVDKIIREKYPDLLFEYIVSSHNFEHLPNPVKFLQGCSSIMADDGYLSMAIPDKRFCFDYFRPVSTTTDFIAALFEGRTRPSPAQIFEQASMQSNFVKDGQYHTGFSKLDNPQLIEPTSDLASAFAQWENSISQSSDQYIDCHCWTFTPSSFELIIRDLSFLGLINFVVVDVTEAFENEFFVHLRHSKPNQPNPDFYSRRKSLLRDVLNECAVNSIDVWQNQGSEQAGKDPLALALSKIRRLWKGS